MRIRFSRSFWTSRVGLTIAAAAMVCLAVAATAFLFTWITFSRMIASRLGGAVFSQTSQVLSAPGRIETGQAFTPQQLIGYLQRAGYVTNPSQAAIGWYQASASAVEIHPGSSSYFAGGNALRVEFAGGKVVKIVELGSNQTAGAAELEPVLLTNLFGSARVKRRVVSYDELPPAFVHAVVSAEDKRFFEHPGLDPLRVAAAAWTDLVLGRKAQGASTITMQVARSFFFNRARTWRRKIEETLMALELERRFSKTQIFDLYANQVYLGNRGSFAIHGFGEAAQAYFGKDIRDLELAQDAFLAGIIRAPNHYSTSDRHPQRAEEARDRVLAAMVSDGYLTPAQATQARAMPLAVVPAALSTSDAPYFVDLVRDQLLERFSESDLTSQSYRIYTTLDPQLQRAAAAAVAQGMQLVDQRLARRYARWRKAGQAVPSPQVALVALDPQTGEIRALVGGRDYGQSQLDHALAHRQPGSVFKPFVYAAAFLNAVDGASPVVTPVTTVVDEPTTFQFDGKQYTPDNFGQQFYGTVTVRQALTHSLNVATVKVAEMIGYDRVLQVARQMKLDEHIEATPAMALGAYEMTPIEVAAGYTAFPNGGVRAEARFLHSVVARDGTVVMQQPPQTTPVLDPRVAYLVTNLMEGVLNHGTGYPVRAMGFQAPAAAKTGTSHDGWFAGFTSQLECIVWVGFDDNRELGLTGADSAGPVWAEFMKRAVQLPGYDRPQEFTPPDGVIEASIDPDSLDLATEKCPDPRNEYFIAGTQPSEYCPLHGGSLAAHLPPPVSWFTHIFGGSKAPVPPGAPVAASAEPARISPPGPASAAPPAPAATPPKEKKGLLHRFFGIFGGKKKPPGGDAAGAKGEPQP
ncbi:MAG TPA: PBP1A family penicillin-binding protein [Candidatus Acidoferrales bacterium]|nr:PBP1A family penicillin-binding protein [Candidatus Acidoferrales bacterium]